MSIFKKYTIPAYAALMAAGTATALIAPAATASATTNDGYYCQSVQDEGSDLDHVYGWNCSSTGNAPDYGQVYNFFISDTRSQYRYGCRYGPAQVPDSVDGRQCETFYDTGE